MIKLKDLKKNFWTVVLMEFCERGAYYGLMSVLSAYLALSIEEGGLGFSKISIGVIKSTIQPLLYALPILSGALSERYGYKPFLIFSFSFLTLGYFFSAFAKTYPFIFLTLIIMAIGAGFFKPLITASISRSIKEGQETIAFGIYYWSINLGATIFPFIVGYLKLISWKYVFFLSAILTFSMVFPSILMYKEPEKPKNIKPLFQVLKEMVLVLKDFKFIGFIFLYSIGFWVLYFQMYDAVLWYFKDFIKMEKVNNFINGIVDINFQFNEAHITVLNAFSIILLQIFISSLLNKARALPTMVLGILIAIFGMFLFGFFQSPYTFIIGIFIFSIGEMVAHPKFISYISLIAPEDKKALYMGYLFLYGVIGSGIGGILSGLSYHYFIEINKSPRGLWLFFCGIGFISVIGLLFFDKFILKKKKC